MGTTRQTSIYTIRLQSPTSVTVTAHGLRHLGIAVCDLGDSSVSFRAGDDETALRIARLAAPPTAARTLTTGLGVHRRDVR
jgi:hypothetical protein